MKLTQNIESEVNSEGFFVTIITQMEYCRILLFIWSCLNDIKTKYYLGLARVEDDWLLISIEQLR